MSRTVDVQEFREAPIGNASEDEGDIEHILDDMFDTDAEEKAGEEISSFLNALEQQNFAKSIKDELRQKLTAATIKLTELFERQKILSITDDDFQPQHLDEMMSTRMTNGTASGSSPMGTEVREDGMPQSAQGSKGDALLVAMQAKKISNLRKQLELSEQKARSVTLQWQADKAKFKEEKEQLMKEHGEMGTRMNIMEQKARLAEQLYRDRNMVKKEGDADEEEESEVEILQRQVESLETDLAAKKQQVAELSLESSDQRMEIVNCKTKIDVLSKRVEELVKIEDTLNVQVDNLEHEEQRLQRDNRLMHEEVEEAKEEARSQTVKVQNLSKMLSEQRLELENKIAVLHNEIRSFEDKQNELRKAHEAAIDEVRKEVAAAEREVAHIRIEKERISSERQHLMLAMTKVAFSSKAMAADIDRHKTKVDAQVAGAMEHANKLQNELKELATGLDEVMKEAKDRAEEEAKLETERKAAVNAMTAKHQQEKSELESRIESLQKSLEFTKNRAAEDLAEIKQHEGQLRALVESELDNANEIIESLNNKIEGLEASGGEARVFRERTEKQLKDLEVGKRELQEEVSAAHDTILKLQEELAKVGTNVVNEHTELARAQLEIIELTQRLKEANERNETIANAAASLAASRKASMELPPINTDPRISIETQDNVDLVIPQVIVEPLELPELSGDSDEDIKRLQNDLEGMHKKLQEANEQIAAANAAAEAARVSAAAIAATHTPRRDKKTPRRRSLNGSRSQSPQNADSLDAESLDVEADVGRGRSPRRSRSKSRSPRSPLSNTPTKRGKSKSPPPPKLKGLKNKWKKSELSDDEDESSVHSPVARRASSNEEDKSQDVSKKSEASAPQTFEEAQNARLPSRPSLDPRKFQPKSMRFLDTRTGSDDAADDLRINCAVQTKMEDPVDENVEVEKDRIEELVREALITDNYRYSSSKGTFTNVFQIDDSFMDELVQSFYNLSQDAIAIARKTANSGSVREVSLQELSPAEQVIVGVEELIFKSAQDMVAALEKAQTDATNKVKERDQDLIREVQLEEEEIEAEKERMIKTQANAFARELENLLAANAATEEKLAAALQKLEDRERRENDQRSPEGHAHLVGVRRASVSVRQSSMDSLESGFTADSSSIDNWAPVAIGINENTNIKDVLSKLSDLQKDELKNDLIDDLLNDARKYVRIAEQKHVAEQRAKANVNAPYVPIKQRATRDIIGLREQIKSGSLQSLGHVSPADFDRLRNRHFGPEDLVALTTIEHRIRYGEEQHDAAREADSVQEELEGVSASNEELKRRLGTQRQYRMMVRSMEIQRDLMMYNIAKDIPILDLLRFKKNTEDGIVELKAMSTWRKLNNYRSGGVFSDVLDVHLAVINRCFSAAGGWERAIEVLEETKDYSMNTEQWPDNFRLRALEMWRSKLLKDKDRQRRLIEEGEERRQRQLDNFVDRHTVLPFASSMDSEQNRARIEAEVQRAREIASKAMMDDNSRRSDELSKVTLDDSTTIVTKEEEEGDVDDDASSLSDGDPLSDPLLHSTSVRFRGGTTKEGSDKKGSAKLSKGGSTVKHSIETEKVSATSSIDAGDGIEKIGEQHDNDSVSLDKGHIPREQSPKRPVAMTRAAMVRKAAVVGKISVMTKKEAATSRRKREREAEIEEMKKKAAAARELKRLARTGGKLWQEQDAKDAVAAPESVQTKTSDMQLEIRGKNMGDDLHWMHTAVDRIVIAALRGKEAAIKMLPLLAEGIGRWMSNQRLSAEIAFNTAEQLNFMSDVPQALRKLAGSTKVTQAITDIREKITAIADYCGERAFAASAASAQAPALLAANRIVSQKPLNIPALEKAASLLLQHDEEMKMVKLKSASNISHDRSADTDELAKIADGIVALSDKPEIPIIEKETTTSLPRDDDTDDILDNAACTETNSSAPANSDTAISGALLSDKEKYHDGPRYFVTQRHGTNLASHALSSEKQGIVTIPSTGQPSPSIDIERGRQNSAVSQKQKVDPEVIQMLGAQQQQIQQQQQIIQSLQYAHLQQQQQLRLALAANGSYASRLQTASVTNSDESKGINADRNMDVVRSGADFMLAYGAPSPTPYVAHNWAPNAMYMQAMFNPAVMTTDNVRGSSDPNIVPVNDTSSVTKHEDEVEDLQMNDAQDQQKLLLNPTTMLPTVGEVNEDDHIDSPIVGQNGQFPIVYPSPMVPRLLPVSPVMHLRSSGGSNTMPETEKEIKDEMYALQGDGSKKLNDQDRARIAALEAALHSKVTTKGFRESAFITPEGLEVAMEHGLLVQSPKVGMARAFSFGPMSTRTNYSNVVPKVKTVDNSTQTPRPKKNPGLMSLFPTKSERMHRQASNISNEALTSTNQRRASFIPIISDGDAPLTTDSKSSDAHFALPRRRGSTGGPPPPRLMMKAQSVIGLDRSQSLDKNTGKEDEEEEHNIAFQASPVSTPRIEAGAPHASTPNMPSRRNAHTRDVEVVVKTSAGMQAHLEALQSAIRSDLRPSTSFVLPVGFSHAYFIEQEFEVIPGIRLASAQRVARVLMEHAKKLVALKRDPSRQRQSLMLPRSRSHSPDKSAATAAVDDDDEEEDDKQESLMHVASWIRSTCIRYCIRDPDVALPKSLKIAPKYLLAPEVPGCEPVLFPAVFPLQQGINLVTGAHSRWGRNIELPDDILLLQVAAATEIPQGLIKVKLSPVLKLTKALDLEIKKKGILPPGHQVVQLLNESVISLPVGVEVAPGVTMAATPADFDLPPNIRLVRNYLKAPLPKYMNRICTVKDDEDDMVSALKFHDHCCIVNKPHGYSYGLGMEVLRRPSNHPLPAGLSLVPTHLYPEGLILPDELELVQLAPRFDFPDGCRLSDSWIIFPRPLGMRLPPGVHIVYPDARYAGPAGALPPTVCPVPMPDIPYGVKLPPKSTAVLIFGTNTAGESALPDGAVLGPGITVLDTDSIMARNADTHYSGRAVNVLLVQRLPGYPLPPLIERGSKADLPTGTLLEENMDIVRVTVRFELPAGVLVKPGVQLGPHTQLCPGTSLAPLQGGKPGSGTQYVNHLQVMEWPHGVSLAPGTEYVARPPEGFYLPTGYEELVPTQKIRKRLPKFGMIVKLPRRLNIPSALQLAEQITVGIESVLANTFVSIPPGMILASRPTKHTLLPAEMIPATKSMLNPKLVALVKKVNSSAPSWLDGDDAKTVGSAFNVEVVRIGGGAHYRFPPGVQLMEGVTVMKRPFWMHLPSGVELVNKFTDNDGRDLPHKKGISRVKMRPEYIRVSLSRTIQPSTDERSSPLDDVQLIDERTGMEIEENSSLQRMTIPEGMELVHVADTYNDIVSWGPYLKGVEAISPRVSPSVDIRVANEINSIPNEKDAASPHKFTSRFQPNRIHSLPPAHYLIERPLIDSKEDLPPGFQLGVAKEYSQWSVPQLPPNVEIMHIQPTYFLPLGVNIVNSSALCKSSLYLTKSKIASQSNFCIPQLMPGEKLTAGCTVIGRPPNSEAMNRVVDADPSIITDAHAFVRLHNPRSVQLPKNIQLSSKSNKVVEEVFGNEVLKFFEANELDANSELPGSVSDENSLGSGLDCLGRVSSTESLQGEYCVSDIIKLVKFTHGLPAPRVRYRPSPSSTAKVGKPVPTTRAIPGSSVNKKSNDSTKKLKAVELGIVSASGLSSRSGAPGSRNGGNESSEQDNVGETDKDVRQEKNGDLIDDLAKVLLEPDPMYGRPTALEVDETIKSGSDFVHDMVEDMLDYPGDMHVPIVHPRLVRLRHLDDDKNTTIEVSKFLTNVCVFRMTGGKLDRLKNGAAERIITQSANDETTGSSNQSGHEEEEEENSLDGVVERNDSAAVGDIVTRHGSSVDSKVRLHKSAVKKSSRRGRRKRGVRSSGSDTGESNNPATEHAIMLDRSLWRLQDIAEQLDQENFRNKTLLEYTAKEKEKAGKKIAKAEKIITQLRSQLQYDGDLKALISRQNQKLLEKTQEVAMLKDREAHSTARQSQQLDILRSQVAYYQDLFDSQQQRDSGTNSVASGVPDADDLSTNSPAGFDQKQKSSKNRKHVSLDNNQVTALSEFFFSGVKALSDVCANSLIAIVTEFEQALVTVHEQRVIPSSTLLLPAPSKQRQQSVMQGPDEHPHAVMEAPSPSILTPPGSVSTMSNVVQSNVQPTEDDISLLSDAEAFTTTGSPSLPLKRFKYRPKDLRRDERGRIVKMSPGFALNVKSLYPHDGTMSEEPIAIAHSLSLGALPDVVNSTVSNNLLGRSADVQLMQNRALQLPEEIQMSRSLTGLLNSRKKNPNKMYPTLPKVPQRNGAPLVPAGDETCNAVVSSAQQSGPLSTAEVEKVFDDESILNNEHCASVDITEQRVAQQLLVDENVKKMKSQLDSSIKNIAEMALLDFATAVDDVANKISSSNAPNLSPKQCVEVILKTLGSHMENVSQNLKSFVIYAMQVEREQYDQCVQQLELEGRILNRNLRYAEQRIDLLENQLQVARRRCGDVDYEQMNTDALKLKLLDLQSKHDRLLEEKATPELGDLEGKIEQFNNLMQMEKQLRFSMMIFKQKAAEVESKMTLSYAMEQAQKEEEEAGAGSSSAEHEDEQISVVGEGSVTGSMQEQVEPPRSALANKPYWSHGDKKTIRLLESNERTALRHHHESLVKKSVVCRQRAEACRVECQALTDSIVEQMEAYQRAAHSVLPPTALAKVLQWSVRTHENLQGKSNLNHPPNSAADAFGVGDHSSSILAKSSPKKNPRLRVHQHLANAINDTSSTSGCDADRQYSQGDALSIDGPPSLMSVGTGSVAGSVHSMGTMTLAESKAIASQRLLSDAARSLQQKPIKFGATGSMPPAPAQSHLVLRKKR